jgi:hypothetical protein
MAYPTGNRPYDSAVAALEMQKQVAMAAAGGNAGAVRAADVAYLQGVVAAGLANGIATLAQTQALTSIRLTGNP